MATTSPAFDRAGVDGRGHAAATVGSGCLAQALLQHTHTDRHRALGRLTGQGSANIYLAVSCRPLFNE